jgi:CheY-like chemotaxis protein
MSELPFHWRILVVDDLPLWGESVQTMAAMLECDVHVATNLNAAVRELGHWSPHLILLDLHMPWDAWEPLAELRHKYEPNQRTLAFCEQVTREPSLNHIVVVVVSVENQVEHQEKAFKAGAHRFFTKGEFTTQLLDDLLDQLHDIYAPSESPG